MSDTLESKDDLRTYTTLLLEEFIDGLDFSALKAGGNVRKITALKAFTNFIRKKVVKLAQEQNNPDGKPMALFDL